MPSPEHQKQGPVRTLLAAAGIAALSVLPIPTPARAAPLDAIGVTQLRARDATLTGTGVSVAQVEASLQGSITAFEVNPAFVVQPVGLFTYIGATGATVVGTFPNAVGVDSSHADTVAGNFYGTVGGVAPGVQHVYNYDANYFYNTLIVGNQPISGSIINQSFIFTSQTAAGQQEVDRKYDNYAFNHGALFISGAGNGDTNNGRVSAPSTSYNGIGVAVYGAPSSVGPTLDNGRSKPDITAPASATSFSTPFVSGAAALLAQAGARGDGGPNTASVATDPRVIKTLLINGAVKPADWTHSPTAPLDTRYGGGILNADNSYILLHAGKHTFSASNTTGSLLGTAPANITGVQDPVAGWDFTTITSTSIADAVNHYVFHPTAAAGVSSYTLTATLTWFRHADESSINDLNLFLYDATTSTTTPLDKSISAVDNVEHLFTLNLKPGDVYDLQILKAGGLAGSATVTDAETYALAYNFAALPESASLALLLVGLPMLFGRTSRRGDVKGQ
ncbi:MAG: hypothetical protein JWN51_2140 [Phycisphaerales bacterium]|nr:hypothetical protein [Phycisphaerales bacterium]